MSDSTLYLYTSLTAGSSHIVTATARLETILKANRIPFRAIDVATDDKARQLWGRYAKGRKLPGLVKYGTIVGVCIWDPPLFFFAYWSQPNVTLLQLQDLDQIEEWNEYGELRMQIESVQDFDGFLSSTSATAASNVPSSTTATPTTPAVDNPTPKPSTIKIQSPPPKAERKDDQMTLTLRQASEEAAAKAKENTRAKIGLSPATSTEHKKDAQSQSPSTSTPTQTEKKETKKEESQSDESDSKQRRKSSITPAPEITRPSLASEVAAESTTNFRADNAEALGLVGHHRGSIVSATSPGEQAKVAGDIRKSVSEGPKEVIEALREEHGIKKMQNEAKQDLSAVDDEPTQKQQDPKDAADASAVNQ